MLVLKLRKHDRVRVGDLTFEIKDAGAGRVRIAFDAPRDVGIQNEPGDPDAIDFPEHDAPRDVILTGID